KPQKRTKSFRLPTVLGRMSVVDLWEMRGKPNVSWVQREGKASPPGLSEPPALQSDEGHRICTPVPRIAAIRRVRRPAHEDGEELSGQVCFTGSRHRPDGNSGVILRIW